MSTKMSVDDLHIAVAGQCEGVSNQRLVLYLFAHTKLTVECQGHRLQAQIGKTDINTRRYRGGYDLCAAEELSD